MYAILKDSTFQLPQDQRHKDSNPEYQYSFY